MKFFSDLDLSMPDEPVRPDAAWSLQHLRPALYATLALAVIGTVTAALVSGQRAVFGVLVGLAIVAAFFSFSAWAVALAGRRDDRLTLPAALGAYLIKLGLLGVVIMVLPTDGPIDTKAMAIAVVAGVIIWSAAQIYYVLNARMYYVDYEPPATREYDQ